MIRVRIPVGTKYEQSDYLTAMSIPHKSVRDFHTETIIEVFFASDSPPPNNRWGYWVFSRRRPTNEPYLRFTSFPDMEGKFMVRTIDI